MQWIFPSLWTHTHTRTHDIANEDHTSHNMALLLLSTSSCFSQLWAGIYLLIYNEIHKIVVYYGKGICDWAGFSPFFLTSFFIIISFAFDFIHSFCHSFFYSLVCQWCMHIIFIGISYLFQFQLLASCHFPVFRCSFCFGAKPISSECIQNHHHVLSPATINNNANHCLCHKTFSTETGGENTESIMALL